MIALLDPEVALGCCRFLHDVAAMLLWGAFAYLATLVPANLALPLGRRLNGVRVTAIMLVLLTAAATLPLQGAMIGDGWPDAVNASMLWAILTDPGMGRAFAVEMSASLLLATTLLAGNKWALATTAIGAGLVLVGLALSGHAAMQEGWIGAAHQANDAVHVLASGGWLGALLPLVLLLGGVKHSPRRGTMTALRRFSAAAHVAVALTILTGIANAGLTMGPLRVDWASPYQILLAAKLALVAVLLGFAVANRYRFMPAMWEDGAKSARAIRKGAIFEIGIGMGVVALVSVFGMLDPA